MGSYKDKYDSVGPFHQGVAIVVKDGKYGAVENGGKEIIAPAFDEIIQLGNSLMAVKTEDGKYSILNYSGRKTTDESFDFVAKFGVVSSPSQRVPAPKIEEGLNYALVGVAGKFGVIDKKGMLLIKPKYTFLAIAKNNLFSDGNGLINVMGQRVVKNGDVLAVLPDEYERGELLDNGMILVCKEGRYGCINRTGEVIIPIGYESLVYQDGLLIAANDDNPERIRARGVINFKNEEIIPLSTSIDQIRIENGIILFREPLPSEYGGWIKKCRWGAYTRWGELICGPQYDTIIPVSDYLFKVGIHYGDTSYSYDWSWGLIDRSGNEIEQTGAYQFFADTVKDGLIAYNDGDGYYDILGNWLLMPCYARVYPFVEGYAIVAKNNPDDDSYNEYDTDPYVYGVIDSSFKEIIPCVFKRVEYDSSLGRFKTEKGYIASDGRFIADIEGKEILIDSRYTYCEAFHDNRSIAVKVDDKKRYYGLIDPASVDILLPMFEYLKLLDCGLYKYKLNGFYGLASADGKIVAPNKYSGIGKFKDNLAIVLIKDDQGKDKHYGYIDTEGEEILQPVYRFIGKRYGNYSVVMSDGKWSIFCWEDKSHQPVPAASYLGPDKDGLCSINIGGEFNVNRSVVKGGRWGYVSPDGKIRIEPRFEKAWGFSEGMAAVKLDGKWGFINKDGEWVVPCEFDKVESSFKDGEGKLIKDGEVYVFDGKGEVVDTYEEVEEDEYEPQDYYDDTPSIFDNPYYNDNLDMDQQSIEFWNSL